MAYNGSGTFIRDFRWTNDLAAHIPITASRMDGEHDGFATGFSHAICKDGQTTTIARIPFASGVGIASGSLAAPGLNFTSDPDCGLYRSAADTLQLVAGGTAAFTLTSTTATVPGTLSVTGTSAMVGDVQLHNDLDVGQFIRVALTAHVFNPNGNYLCGGNIAIAGDLTVKNGTAAAPSINFLNDSTTGPYRAGVEIYGISIAGVGKLRLDSTAVSPVTDGGTALGSAGRSFSHCFLNASAVINFNNSNMMLTHTTNKLTLSGAVPASCTLNVEGNLTVTGSDFVVTGGSGVVNTIGEYRVSGTKVVGAQLSAVANATGSGDAHTVLNVLLSRLRVHGLIDT